MAVSKAECLQKHQEWLISFKMLFLTNTSDKEQPSVTISSYITTGIENEKSFLIDWLFHYNVFSYQQ